MYNHFSPKIPGYPRNLRIMEAVKEAAVKYQGEEIAELRYSQYRIYFQTGSRTEYEACYIKHRRRLNVYAAMALYSDDAVWIAGLEDIIWAICNEFTWAFPAHIRDFGDIEESSRTVDLFAAETGQALSEICHLLAGRISEQVVKRAELEVRRRLIVPYTEKKLRFHRDNWSAVCAGCIGMAVMYWGGWEEFSAIKDQVLESMEDFTGSYQEDGCCLEGALYWAYGFGYFCYFAEMLRECSGGTCDLFKQNKIKRIALFRQEVYLEKDVVVPFADAPHNYGYHLGLLHFLAKEYEEAEVPEEEYASGFDDDIRHRFADFIRDFYWYDPLLTKERKAEDTCIFAQSQWYLKKKKEYSFAVKGGRNNEPHNHNDIGSFVIFSDGKFIIDDLGWPEYDAGYFGPKRYDNLCASSAGHSVPILDGALQERGREHKGKVLEAGENQVSLELAGAYPAGRCESLVRRFVLEERRVRMEEELTGGKGKLVERFITRIPPVRILNAVKIGGWTISCPGFKGKISIGEQEFKPRLDICKMDMNCVEKAYFIDFVMEECEVSQVIFNFEKGSGIS